MLRTVRSFDPRPREGATAPKDSRTYGCRGSFHLIAACGLTALHFPLSAARSRGEATY